MIREQVSHGKFKKEKFFEILHDTESSHASKPGETLDHSFCRRILWQHPANKASDFISTKSAEAWETNRRIRADILSHTSSVSHLSVQLVLIDAV